MKKYLPYIAIGILLIVVYYQQSCINNANDEAIAQMMQEKVMAKWRSKWTNMSNSYNEKIAKLMVEKAKVDTDLANTGKKADEFAAKSEERRKELLKIKDCPTRAKGLDHALFACNNFTLALKCQYDLGIFALNLSWNGIVAEKNKQISDQDAMYGALVIEHGDLVKKYTIAKLRAMRRLNFGGFCGYDFLNKRFSAGLGFTIDLIKIPIKIF